MLTTVLFFYNSLFPQQLSPESREKVRSWLQPGIAMGLLGIILMLFSFNVSDTFIFDYRHIAVVTAAMIGGPFSSIIAAIIVGSARLFIQGSITTTSIVALINIVAIGIAATYVVRHITGYLMRWAAHYIVIVILTSCTVYFVMGKDSLAILPDFFLVMMVGTMFTAYLIHYLSQSSLRQHQVTISEQKYRQISSLQEAIFQSASEVAIIVTDSSGRITTFNKGAENLLGYAAHEVIGAETPLLFHLKSEVDRRGEEMSRLSGKKITGFDVFTENPRNGKADEREWTYVRKDGSHLSINLILTGLWIEDEIHGFIGIATDVTDKKQSELALQEQNEELQAQQEELQAQQDELTDVLVQMEASESSLRKRNQLSLSLSNSLNRSILLQSVTDAFASIYQADRGIMVMLDASRDYASYGISNELAKQFIDRLDDYFLPRLYKDKRPFMITRMSEMNENGYHADSSVCSDLFVPILNAKEELSALLTVTRMGDPITSNEVADAAGLALQISLAIDKLKLHEVAIDQQELVQNMLDTIQEGLQLLDTQGNIIQVNTQFQTLIGQEQLQGMTLAQYMELVRPVIDNPQAFEDYLHNQLARPGHNHASLVYTIQGHGNQVIRVYCEPLYRADQLYGLLFVHRDITREYELDKMKSDFVNTVSHELRTPLSSILGFAELMLNKEQSPEKRMKYVSTIHQEATRLSVLINDFLDLQRMESGRQTYNFKPFDLVSSLHSVIDLFKDQPGICEFHLQHPPTAIEVFGDEDKLKQVMMNLLSNAYKYSPNGGNIEVSITQQDDRWLIAVKDEGLGIPAEAIPHLFSKFYRIDLSDRRKIGGTGLGLAIVNEIINAHHGQITVDSTLGAGSTFTLILPTLASVEAAATI